MKYETKKILTPFIIGAIFMFGFSFGTSLVPVSHAQTTPPCQDGWTPMDYDNDGIVDGCTQDDETEPVKYTNPQDVMFPGGYVKIGSSVFNVNAIVEDFIITTGLSIVPGGVVVYRTVQFLQSRPGANIHNPEAGPTWGEILRDLFITPEEVKIVGETQSGDQPIVDLTVSGNTNVGDKIGDWEYQGDGEWLNTKTGISHITTTPETTKKFTDPMVSEQSINDIDFPTNVYLGEEEGAGPLPVGYQIYDPDSGVWEYEGDGVWTNKHTGVKHVTPTSAKVYVEPPSESTETSSGPSVDLSTWYDTPAGTTISSAEGDWEYLGNGVWENSEKPGTYHITTPIGEEYKQPSDGIGADEFFTNTGTVGGYDEFGVVGEGNIMTPGTIVGDNVYLGYDIKEGEHVWQDAAGNYHYGDSPPGGFPPASDGDGDSDPSDVQGDDPSDSGYDEFGVTVGPDGNPIGDSDSDGDGDTPTTPESGFYDFETEDFWNTGDSDSDSDTDTDDSSGGFGCFLAGTQILMSDGSTKAIDAIEVGEYVYTYDEYADAYVSRMVIDTYEHEYEGEYFVVNDTLRVTPNHITYVNKEWVRIDTAEIGDSLFSEYFMTVPIESINTQYTTENVYNLEIDEVHTYMAEGYLVHNIK